MEREEDSLLNLGDDDELGPVAGGPDDGVIENIGRLPEGALLTEAGLARIMRKHPASIRRAVTRGELPPPIRLMGKPTWTAGAILAHVEKRLEAAAKERGRLDRKISDLGA